MKCEFKPNCRAMGLTIVAALIGMGLPSCAFKKVPVVPQAASPSAPEGSSAAPARSGDSLTIQVSKDSEPLKRYFTKQGEISQTESIATLPVLVPDQIKIQFSLFGIPVSAAQGPKLRLEAFGRKSPSDPVAATSNDQIVMAVDPKEVIGPASSDLAFEIDASLTGLRLLLSDNESGEAFVTFYIRNSASGALLTTLIVGLRTPPRANVLTLKNNGLFEFKARVATTGSESESALALVNAVQTLSSPSVTLHLHRVIEITSASRDPIEVRMPSQMRGQFSETKRNHVTSGGGCHQAYSYNDAPRSNDTTYYVFQLSASLPAIWTGEFRPSAKANGAGDSGTLVEETSVFLPKNGSIALIGLYSVDHVEREVPQSTGGYACGWVCDSWNFVASSACYNPEAPEEIRRACNSVFNQTSMVCDFCRKGDRGSCTNCQSRDGNSGGFGTFCTSGWFLSQSPGTVYNGSETLPYTTSWSDRAMVPQIRWGFSGFLDDPEGAPLDPVSPGTVTW